MKGEVSFYALPGDKDLHEFPEADKTIGHESQATQQGKGYYDIMGGSDARAGVAEAGGQPFSAGRSVGAAKPAREIHHHKDLVKDGPEPGDPNAFHPIYKTETDHPHRAGDVEHIRGIAQAKHIPGQGSSTQQIIQFVLPGLFAKDPADHDHRDQVGKDDEEIR